LPFTDSARSSTSSPITAGSESSASDNPSQAFWGLFDPKKALDDAGEEPAAMKFRSHISLRNLPTYLLNGLPAITGTPPTTTGGGISRSLATDLVIW
jgi:hypothetical protein